MAIRVNGHKLEIASLTRGEVVGQCKCGETFVDRTRGIVEKAYSRHLRILIKQKAQNIVKKAI